MDDLHTILSNAAKGRAKKLGKEHFQRMAQASYQKRTAGMSTEQIKEYFRNIRTRHETAT